MSRQRTLIAPSAVQPRSDRGGGQARAFCPFLHAQRQAGMRDVSTTAAIARLRLVVYPSTVLQGIWAVIVDAVEFVSRWARTHVGEKRGVVKPSLADRDSAATVPLVSRVVRPKAAVFHLLPDHVFPWAFRTALGSPVRGGARGCQFAAEAPTTSDELRDQVGRSNGLLSAAVATTEPFAELAAYVADRHQTFELLAEKIGARYSGRSHAVSPVREGVVRGRAALLTSYGLANYPTQILTVAPVIAEMAC